MLFIRKSLILLGLILFAAFSQSCGPRLSSEAQEFLSTSVEVPECTTEFSYTNPINVTGQAKFFKRGIDITVVDNKIKNLTLSDPLIDPLPIPYAEVAVYSSDKKLVQCGLTDIDGNLKSLSDISQPLQIPNKAQSYIIRVYARANMTMPNKGFVANASVKEDPYTNKVYYLENTFSSDGVNITPIDLTAYARQTEDLAIKGGAFNIYNNFIQAYKYLDDNLTVSNSELTCLSSKFSIYWKAGFNPLQYEYPSADPNTLDNTSYYKKETDSLFISGGQVGNVSLSNTDHFDDFASIHEIGHFIEDQCGRLDTPGGLHYIIFRIDGRLAWHEGWANYFAGVVTNARQNFINPKMSQDLASSPTDDKSWSFLFNSSGFSDSVQNVGNGTAFTMDLKKPGTSPGEWQIGQSTFGLPFDLVNPTLYPGEGHFREGAITRALFKMTVPKATLCSSCATAVFASSPVVFNSMWQAFDAFGGIANSDDPFSNSNQFLEKIKSLVGPATWASDIQGATEAEALHLFSDHNLSSVSKKYVTNYLGTDYLNWIPLGHKLEQTVCTKPLMIQPRSDDPFLTGTNSDQRYSNHFYTIDPSVLVGLNSIAVTFTKGASVGTNTDHDIIIFEEDYRFNGDYVCSGNESITGSCLSNQYVASRGTNSFVVASNRSASSNLTSYSKSISNLATKLDPTKKYLLNIRAYTPSKSIGNATSYIYSLSSNLGPLCPE